MMAGVAVLVGGCGGSSSPSTSDIANQIRPALRRQLQQRAGSEGRVHVDGISCVKQSDSQASCLADLSASDGSKAKVSIDVKIDPKTGNAIWTVQQ